MDVNKEFSEMDNVKKNKALKILRHTSFLQVFLVALLLILGGVAINHHGDVAAGIPTYYTGVFIVSPMALLTATLGIAIYFRGRKCFNKTVAEQKIGCLVRTYCVSLPFNWLLCFIAVLIVAFTGICTVSECSYLENTGRNFRLAVTILTFILLIFVSEVVGLILICIYANHFGVKLFARGQRRIANSVTESPQTSVCRPTTHDDTFITTLQAQNQILQQHVQINNTYVESRQNQLSPQQRPMVSVRMLSHRQPVFPGHVNRSSSGVIIPSSGMMNIQNEISPSEQYQMAQSATFGGGGHQHQVQHRPHRKKKKRRKMSPSHPSYSGQGTSYVLPPIVNRGQPPPPPSPPPPPNTPPPPSSDSFDTEPSAPPPYFINEHVDHTHDLPPPYTP